MPPEPDVQFRRATPADGPAFVALVRALAEYEKLPGPDDDAARRLLADAFAPSPRYDLWVADRGGEVVAYAVTFATYSTFRAQPGLFLEDLFVHPRVRRRGIARHMLAELEAEARRRGCGRFEWLVLDWNVDAQALYRSIGAELLPDWRVVRKNV